MLPRFLEELKPRPVWVGFLYLWNAAKKAGRGGFDKPPIDPHTLKDARVNDPATWADYETAAGNIGKQATHRDTKHKDEEGNAPTIRANVHGVGVVLTGGLCGVDFDDVIDDAGNVAPWAADIVKRLDTYTELSVSGRGLHSLLICEDLLKAGQRFSGHFYLNAAGQVITEEARKVYELEIYAPTGSGPYFTISGNVYHAAPIRRDGSAVLADLFREYSGKRAQARANNAPSVQSQYTTAGRAASADDNIKMLRDALRWIDPAGLVFNEWASVMTAGKYAGLGLDVMQEWSAGRLYHSGAVVNQKNDPTTNARRWDKMHFDGSTENAGGVIVNLAKMAGWSPADAFDDQEKADYGRSLYTDEQRRKYGQDQHQKRLQEFDAKHGEAKEYFQRETAQDEPAADPGRMAPEDVEALRAACDQPPEDLEAEHEREKLILYRALLAWHSGEGLSDELREQVETFDPVIYDSQEELFQAWGLVDAAGDLTEWGRDLLENGEPGADPGQPAGEASSVQSQEPEATAQETETEEGEAALSVQSQEDSADDRRDGLEPAAMTAADWEANNCYAVTLYAVKELPPIDDKTKKEVFSAVGHADYMAARADVHALGLYILAESFETEEDYFPGLVTFESVTRELKEADSAYLEIKNFPQLSKVARIRTHDTVILAAETGGGKTSLALNFVNDLLGDYPIIYINCEMGRPSIFRRLVAMRSGMPIRQAEGYNHDERTRAAVNDTLRAITSGKRFQLIDDVHNIEDIERIIAKCTRGRKEPTLVFIDHGLLVDTQNRKVSRYERFTAVSENLRLMSKKYNIIMFTLLQQNRAGKQTNERPALHSLKESGSWENDSTHVFFLWWDDEIKRKRVIFAKNRDGDTGGDVVLDYWPQVQQYREAPQAQAQKTRKPAKLTTRGFKKATEEQSSIFDRDIYTQARGTETAADVFTEWENEY